MNPQIELTNLPGLPARPRLLVVDDQPINIQVLYRIFTRDHEVFAATSGEQALTFCRSTPPDLILLDVMMQGMDGLEVCRRLKADATLATIPVIFVTAQSDPLNEALALETGGVDFISKPVNPAVVRARVRTHLMLRTYESYLEKLVEARTGALLIAKEAAEAANRAKTTFLTTMSHELRTPLNGIVGFTNLALRRETDPKIRSYLERAEKCSQNLTGIINDVLDITRIEAERLTLEQVEFRLGEVLDGVRSLAASQCDAKGLGLRLEVSGDLGQKILCGDPTRLGQILLNLVGNAVKFTGAGSVTIRAFIIEETDARLCLRFEVQDSGIGIPKEDSERIFAPFEQGDGSMTRKYGGTGLGLPICRRLVRLMGGDLSFESSVGQGSTFWFSLCFSRAESVGAVEAEAAGQAMAEIEVRACHAGRRILVVEDERVNQEVSREILQDVGLVVDIAANGVEAVERARECVYDIILMDMQMPLMNGVEATRAIRKIPALQETPILAMTANAFSEDRLQCLEAGMNDFMAKPINPEALYLALLKWFSPLAR